MANGAFQHRKSPNSQATIMERLPEELVPHVATEAWMALDKELHNSRLLKKRERERNFEQDFLHLNNKIRSAIKDEQNKAVARENKRLFEQQRLKELQQQEGELARLEAEARETAQRKAEEEKIKQEQAKRTAGMQKYSSETAMKESEEFLLVLQQYKTETLPALANDKPLFQFCFLKKMSVRTKIGQVSNIKEVFIEKANLICNELDAARQKSPTAYEWLLNYTAKQTLDQAQSEAALNRAIALALGNVVLLILQRHPTFLKFFMGRLYKRCLVAVPRFIDHTAVASDKDFFLEQRYRKVSDTDFEEEEKFCERMSGMIALLAAILSSGLPQVQVPAILQPLLWKWPARLLSLPPRRITPIVLLAFLEIAGAALTRTYKRQAEKLINYIYEVYLPKCPKAAVAATTRCKLWLEKNWVHAPSTFGMKCLPHHPEIVR